MHDQHRYLAKSGHAAYRAKRSADIFRVPVDVQYPRFPAHARMKPRSEALPAATIVQNQSVSANPNASPQKGLKNDLRATSRTIHGPSP